MWGGELGSGAIRMKAGSRKLVLDLVCLFFQMEEHYQPYQRMKPSRTPTFPQQAACSRKWSSENHVQAPKDPSLRWQLFFHP